MKFATLAMVALVAAALAPAAASAAMPDGKIAVVRVTAVDGLAHYHATSSKAQNVAFSHDGMEYRIDRSKLSSLDGVQTLLLIDWKREKLSGGSVVEFHEQEVRAFDDTSFQVTDLNGKTLSYQVAMVGGNLRLLGAGDQISVKTGEGGPFQVWKVTGIDLVDHNVVTLR